MRKIEVTDEECILLEQLRKKMNRIDDGQFTIFKIGGKYKRFEMKEIGYLPQLSTTYQLEGGKNLS